MSVCNKSFNLSSAKAILRLFQICCYKKKKYFPKICTYISATMPSKIFE